MDENFTRCPNYLHLSKAFDALNFDILISKLKFYGIIGTLLKLIDNYLRNRHQFVTFKNINSDLQAIRTGIPQGSIVDTLFFSIYINDFIESNKLFNYLMYYLFIYLFIQHFYSALFINKYALMRYKG